MDKRNLKLLYENIETIRIKEGLICLSDTEYVYKGINVLERFEEKHPFEGFDQEKHNRDLELITKDLMIFTSQLYLYFPFINDPMKETSEFEGRLIHEYHQNGYDWFYSTYCSCCYEKLYNFWDRIGDRLSVSFETNLNRQQIGFGQVMNKLSMKEEFLSNPYFKYLYDYWKTDFKEFNKIRIDIVHYYQFESYYKDEFLQNTFDTEKIQELWDWKKNLPLYFKEQLIKCCDGFWNMVMLEKSINLEEGE